jgi:hypothetical protein
MKEQLSNDQIIAARRAFARVVNSPDPTNADSYPQIFDFGKSALVVQASKRKFQFLLMFPQVAGQEGSEIVEITGFRWKHEASSYQVDSAIDASISILKRRAVTP